MTWNLDNSLGYEVAKMRWELVPYMRGRCLDLGCGPAKAFPHFIGIDSGKDTDLFGIQMRPDVKADITDLSIYASGSIDLVFSSHALEHIEDWKAALKEWWRVVKVGGHLALYLPHADFYPRCANRDEWKAWIKANAHQHNLVDSAIEAYADIRRAKGETRVGVLYEGTPYSNIDHEHDFLPQDIVDGMKSLGGGFDLVHCEERNEKDEYSFLVIFKKISSGVKESWHHRPAKMAAVVRYGAIGDQIQTSSIFPWLKEQGYHLTVYCQSGQGYEAIKHDPHIDRFIIQEKDAVPPQFLGEFWDYTRKKYDKWVNLSESVESTLLASPGRVNWEWPNEVRAKYLDRNYLEWIHELAEVPPPYRPKFYSTEKEKEWARKTKQGIGKRVVLWSLAGSSGHKVWPHLDAAIAGMMLHYPDVHVVLVGDQSCQILEQGWEKERRVHRQSGKWSIRESMAFAEAADLIIGTETGLLNAAGAMDVPKIVCLSHSSQEMLTKHWVKTIALQQPKGVGCHKSPCRQLHGSNGTDTWADCPRHEETGTSLCQFNISPPQMWAAITCVLGVPMQIEKRAA